MPAADPTTRATTTSLLNYDVPSSGSDSEGDIFARLDKTLAQDPHVRSKITKTTKTGHPKTSITTHNPKLQTSTSTSTKRPNDDLGLGLGIDETLSIPKKKRRQTPKLDSTLLLSPAGLPHLLALAENSPNPNLTTQQESKSSQDARSAIAKKIGLRGSKKAKGGEFGDAERLLAFYQLWLDGLFPRARFRDALLLVEKAGRGREVAVWRGGMARRLREREFGMGGGDGDGDRSRDGIEGREGGQINGDVTGGGKEKDKDDGEDMFFPDAGASGVGSRPKEGLPEEDDEEGFDEDLEALLAQQDARIEEMERETGLVGSTKGHGEQEMNDDEDELDAILAEQEARM